MSRRNGPYTLVMNAGGLYRLPFGQPSALTDGVDFDGRPCALQSRVLVLGDSLSDFMRELGIYSSDGKAALTRLPQSDEIACFTLHALS